MRDIPVELREVASDRKRGARALVLEAARAVEMWATDRSEPAACQKDLERLAGAVLNAQPEMAPFYHLAATVLEARAHPSRLGPAVRSFVSSVEEDTAPDRAAKRIRGSRTVVTYSRSGSVQAALEMAAGQGGRLRVLVGEGRPGYEGRVLARDLADVSGLEVELMTDAALLARVATADLGLVGADAVGGRQVRNKVGTRALAEVARVRSLPVFVVADETKFLPEDLWRRSHERPAAEVWPDAPAGVEVANPYFEGVPMGALDGVITGRGILRPEDVQATIDRLIGRFAPLRELLDL